MSPFNYCIVDKVDSIFIEATGVMEAAKLLFILYHCVLAMFLILKNCQVSVIFCHCFSLDSGNCSIAVYFVSLCPGNFSNSEKLTGQCYFLSLLFSE